MRALLVVPVLLLAGISLADTETTTLTPLTKEDCLNGGVFNEEDASCSCQSYWGDRDCSQIECVNGGYPFSPEVGENDVCHCPKGYYGIHCDAVKLARPVEGVFNMEKSFSLYIHNELTDWYGMAAFAAIKKNVESILQDYSFDSYNWIVSERGKPEKEFMQFTGANSKTNFINKVVGADPKRTGTYTCAQTDISYASLLKTLQDNKIEDSVMLMFTQYPPTNDDKALADLKKYLRAFRIKLNVLIGSDDILLDCDSNKNKDKKFFEELTSLVHYTDGEIASYLIEDENDPDELLPAFIRASASPQSHARIASKTCGGAKGAELVFQTDPYPNTYYIAVRSDEKNPATISGTCSSGGEVSEAILSYNEEFSLFTLRSGAQQTCTLFVLTGTECVATVYSVGGEKDVDAFDIFHSFSTTEDMDTDSISTYQNEDYFLTMHIQVPVTPKYKIKRFEGTITVINEIEIDVLFEKNLTTRGSTFEYQSEEKFPCPKDGVSWIQLNLNGFTEGKPEDPPVAVLNRMIHLNCEERKAGEVTPPKMFRMFDVTTPTIQRPTFAILYSNWLPIPQYSSFILASVDKDLIPNLFSEFGFLRFDASPQMDFDPLYTVDKFDDFSKAVYDFGPDKTLTKQENLQQNLEKLTGSTSALSSDSLVAIAVQHCYASNSENLYPSNLNALSNLGAKLLFLGDVDTVKIVNPLDSIEIFTKMAAVSAGHFVLMDMSDFNDDDPEAPFYVSLALRDLYTSGPSQRLLSYSNLQWEKTPGSTSQSKPIGTLQVPANTTEVFLSITLNVEDPKDVGLAFMLSLVLEGTSDRIVLDIQKDGDFTVYGTPGFVRSNLYTAKITVVEGESYEGTFTVLATTPYTGAHIRFWTDRTEGDVIPDLKYVDFDMKSIQPDIYLGAALHVPDLEGKSMSLRFRDENGIESILSDHNQTVEVLDGVAHFVPFFCDSAQSASLSKNMYTIEVTYDSGFKYFRPMYCSDSNEAPKCKDKDNEGNTFCVESNPPFHRGPSEKLIDCSGVGQVVYSEKANAENHYECVCEESYTGKSCEQSSCPAGIDHLPEESDASYRTLSYVLMSPAGQDACSSLNAFYAKDAKALFDETKHSYKNIWQYTFSVYFTDGTAKTLYRGPSFDTFYSIFEMLEDESDDGLDTLTFCGDEKQTKPIDLNEVFNLAVESVGRKSRGIVFLYAIQTFADQLEQNELFYAIADDELYQSIQAYQQHIYMVTPTITEDLISLTTASGGFVVRLYDEYAHFENSATKYKEILTDLLDAEIGWAVVSNANTTRDPETPWIIRQEAHLFITSGTIKGGVNNPPVVTGDPSISISSFSIDDDEDDDGTVTQYASISATKDAPVKITITFDPTKEYDLVQVVVLTKKDPILNALIGQGQANTDKHAAGATFTSTKAAHISFNQKSTDLFFQPTDDNWRQASRVNCSFAQEFVAFVQPFETAGASIVDFTVSPKKDPEAEDSDPDTSKSFSLSVPLAVSETIDCLNGGAFEKTGSFCECGSNWSGPTCSQPTCQNGGVLNSHGDHCDCTGLEFGGVFCEKPKPPPED